MPRSIAQLLSILFHPLTILTYIVISFLLLNPYLFGKNDISQGGGLILQVFFATFCLPAMATAIMKGVGLISSFEMEDRRERIIPYIATITFYLWIFMTVRKQPAIPSLFNIAVLGSILSLFVTFFINNFTKISAHAVGIGGLIGAILIALRWFAYSYFQFSFGGEKVEFPSYYLFMLCLLIGGLVCSARLWLNAHVLRDIIGGFVVGIVGQYIAYIILN
jgi:membrane-associated phospholipid phosphatase